MRLSEWRTYVCRCQQYAEDSTTDRPRFECKSTDGREKLEAMGTSCVMKEARSCALSEHGNVVGDEIEEKRSEPVRQAYSKRGGPRTALTRDSEM